MKSSIWYIIGILLILGLGYGLWHTLENEEEEIQTSVSVAEAMAGGGDQEGYLRVTGPREFTFPDDHGSHPGYKTEWWYYTGNLFTEDGRQFGYQFTIFRNQLSPPPSSSGGGQDSTASPPPSSPPASGGDRDSTTPSSPSYSDGNRDDIASRSGISRENTAARSAASNTADSKRTPPPKSGQDSAASPSGTSWDSNADRVNRATKLGSTSRSDSGSAWDTNQLYLGHFAISDVKNKNHVFEERFSRGAAGLAGAQAEPYRIWLEDWEVKNNGKENVGERNFPVRIKAEMADGSAIDLNIRASKPLTLQGEEGYDRKGAKKGNASSYHSFTRMETEGVLRMNGSRFEVSGSSWMDHEWSTSALDDGQEGWDWFSIQLSNGYDLMYYQLRNIDGSVSKFTTGSLVGPDGEKTTIGPGDVEIEVLDRWESPHSGSIYPSKWNMRIPEHDLSLDLQTLFDDQEMDVSVRYYEGTVSVSGRMNGEDIGGNGFIEMTGYEKE